jgi:D-3-phosphoglycerate dehydrogenase
MSQFKVVVTDDRYDGCYEEERAVFADMDVDFIIANCADENSVIEVCGDADGILCNLAPMSDRVVNSLNKCSIISRYGVGYDNVAVSACTAKGIKVANVTDYCAEEVSDQALALIMACSRKVARRDAQVRAGMWNIGQKDPIHRMAGGVFTFLGFGMIAKTLHRKIKGMNFSEVLVFDPFLDADAIAAAGARKVDWDEAISKADFISIHMPSNEKTKGIVNEAAFDMMKDNAILVNTSRGAVIDEDALINALREGKINSAGLDVHVNEPMNADNPLLKIENCVLTDHVGWYSEESMSELKRKVAQNVKDVLLGGEPNYPVN